MRTESQEPCKRLVWPPDPDARRAAIAYSILIGYLSVVALVGACLLRVGIGALAYAAVGLGGP